MSPRSAFRLTGATLLSGGALRPGALVVAGGRIAGATSAPLPEVALTGFLILPGIVDLLGRAPPDANPASVQAQAARAGVTTSWLDQGWSWEGGAHTPEAALRRLAAQAREAAGGADLRIRLRAETHLTDQGARLLQAVREFGVDYVVFSDLTERAAALHRTDPGAFARWAAAMGRDATGQARALQTALAQRDRVPRHLCHLAAAFDRLGIRYGSHADPGGAEREYFSMLGARLAELPLSHAAAAAARAVGDPVLAAAPDIAPPASRPPALCRPPGAISAADLIRAGLCDALVSDGAAPALAAAALTLARESTLPFPEAWALISSRPARLMGLCDRGALTEGARADIVVLDPATRRIEACLAAGRPLWLGPALRPRFQAITTGARAMAAR